MVHKFTFAETVIDAGHILDFVEAAQRYCSSGRKVIRQGVLTFNLFLNPVIRPAVSWVEVENALGWNSSDQGLATRRTTLVNKLKDICFEMCGSIDPVITRIYNHRFISLRAERNSGIVLCKLTHYKGQPIEDVVKTRLSRRIQGLTIKGSNTLSVEEMGELYYARKFLDEDLDAPFKMMGPYRIEKERGRGSTARVFCAQHEYSGERYALKVLNADLARNMVHRERFFRGAQAMLMLSHPYILKVVDIGDVHNDRPYYVAELIDGGTLAEMLEQKQTPPAEKIALLGKVLSALREAHTKGVVHRDLKPENILINQDGDPKVTDFDCAYISNFSTLTSMTVPGTLHYMSPERLEEPTSRYPDDDVYAFGMIAIELLSGHRHRPFEEMLREVDAVPEFRRLRAILMRCVARRAQGRYPSAEPLISDWNAALESDALRHKGTPIIVSPATQVNYAGQDLSGRVFDQQNLRGSIFRDAILRGCSFRRSVLSEAVLIGADLRDCCFDGAFMIGARLQNSNIRGATFRMANLERTVWDSVDLKGVDFTGANFWGAFLEKAKNFRRAILKFGNFSRNIMSADQEKFLKTAPDATHTDNYQDYFALARARFSDKLPEELWWAKIADEPDSMLEYY